MPGLDGAKITVFLADDSLLVREGVRALLAVAARPRGRRASPRTSTGWSHGADETEPAGRRHRHPHAAELPERGHRGGQAGAHAQPGHRRRRALAVRRARVRDLAARRRRGRLRLPAEGPRRRRRPARAARSARSRPAAACSTRRSSQALVAPARADGELDEREDQLLQWIAEGRPVKAIAAALGHHARSGERRDRGAVPQARQGSERGPRERAAPAPPAAEGDRRPRGAGRDAAAGCCPAGSPRSCASERPRDRRDRAPRRSRC